MTDSDQAVTPECHTEVDEDEGACWIHGDEAISSRSEHAIRTIEHCTICDKDVRWSFGKDDLATALAERGYRVSKEPELDFDAMRMAREWPTPHHMRRAADALDIFTPAKYGDVLRWFADRCDEWTWHMLDPHAAERLNKARAQLSQAGRKDSNE